MARWGFNCVRPALHYNLFTLAIEDEPVQVSIPGWRLVVRLDSWWPGVRPIKCTWCSICTEHRADRARCCHFRITTLQNHHSGKASQQSQNLLRFGKNCWTLHNNPWIAGYDLINETNWTFPEGNNSQLRSLYGGVTTAIREVDKTICLWLKATGLPTIFGTYPAWDNNMCYSFHKYWTVNNTASIQWVLDLRNNTNCPIWLVNRAKTQIAGLPIALNWWRKQHWLVVFLAGKKSGINNILKVTTNSDYTNLINYWKGTAAKPTVDKAFQAVMTFANNHKLENCDSIRRDWCHDSPASNYRNRNHLKPQNTTASTIYAVDYDFGRAAVAYSDKVDANYHLTNNNYTHGIQVTLIATMEWILKIVPIQLTNGFHGLGGRWRMDAI